MGRQELDVSRVLVEALQGLQHFAELVGRLEGIQAVFRRDSKEICVQELWLCCLELMRAAGNSARI